MLQPCKLHACRAFREGTMRWPRPAHLQNTHRIYTVYAHFTDTFPGSSTQLTKLRRFTTCAASAGIREGDKRADESIFLPLNVRMPGPLIKRKCVLCKGTMDLPRPVHLRKFCTVYGRFPRLEYVAQRAVPLHHLCHLCRHS